MQKSRTQRAITNVSITMICQIIYILMSIVCRTVFTKILGAEYLGLNGLFSNILTMLSFVELGIGNALVYKMYAPLVQNDKHMLCVYMQFYKKVYTFIAITVAILGICIVPFLNYIVDTSTIDINVQLLYLLFLADTVISYLYVYKKTILIADQKNYIVSIFTQVFNLAMNIGQIIILLITHNFIFYLLIKIFFDWLNNFICSKYAEWEYPYINSKVCEDISKSDKNELKEDIKGLFLGKIASVAFDGTDNIFISTFVSIASVGIVSNYTLILSTINGILNQAFSSFTASLGNLGVGAQKEDVRGVLKNIYFLNIMLYGYIFVGLVLLLRMFVVDIWVGTEYELACMTTILLITELCLRGIHYPVYITRTAMGLFHQKKYIPPMCAVLNIGLDFLFGKKLGISGIVFATIVSRVFTRAADISVLYREYFKISVSVYYRTYLKYLLFIVGSTIISYYGIQLVSSFSVVMRFIASIGIVTAIYWGLVFAVFFKSKEFNYFYKMVCEKIIRRQK